MNKYPQPETNHDNNLRQINSRIAWSKGIGIGLGIAGFLLAFYPQIFLDIKQIYFNTYGDYVGGVSGTILSLGAMAFLYMTYQVQQKQIAIQQEEMNKNELEGKTQRLHTWFFTLFQLHIETVKGFDIRKKETGEMLASGRDCFNYFYRDFERKANKVYKKHVDEINAESVQDGSLRRKPNFKEQDIAEVFRNSVWDTYPDLDVYFKSLGAMLRHISKMEADAKIISTDYAETVRSQLSAMELVFIHYYCHMDETKMNKIMVANKKEIQRHGMMLHLREDRLIKVKFDQYNADGSRKDT